ncbi:hypothetical protein [Cytobacillus purgationiresistens]|uniref:3-hydroxybutyryl-CoA dehydratase n=1 Tax=Cytobacillus purgationiresistens TaxID=863449 RepID=A0ABU0AF17_9BACI|nr:hypothetical protein [Cytobacillus purgationiresistens]MDQ0269849.1 3-hydroxybutyryl-CoA dehydratase [Cytobacillus purgationiresistens]
MMDYFVGQMAVCTRIFTEEDVKNWGTFTKGMNIIDESIVDGERKIQIPTLIYEGFISELISSQLPGQPCVMMQKELLFVHPVYGGNAITVNIEVIDVISERKWLTEKVVCTNESGLIVMKGQVVLKIL